MHKPTSLVILALVAVVALTASALIAGPALAGKGNGNGNGNHSSAVLWTEPSNPYPAWGFDFEVHGSGFNPNSVVHISLTPNGVSSNVLADSNGDIWFGWTTGEPGTYTFSAYQDLQGSHWSVYASVDVQVVAP